MHTDPAAEGDSGLISMVPQDSAAIAAQRRAAELFELPFAADAVVVQRNPDGPVADRAARRLRPGGRSRSRGP